MNWPAPCVIFSPSSSFPMNSLAPFTEPSPITALKACPSCRPLSPFRLNSLPVATTPNSEPPILRSKKSLESTNVTLRTPSSPLSLKRLSVQVKVPNAMPLFRTPDNSFLEKSLPSHSPITRSWSLPLVASMLSPSPKLSTMELPVMFMKMSTFSNAKNPIPPELFSFPSPSTGWKPLPFRPLKSIVLFSRSTWIRASARTEIRMP